jgi:hypothetical protein
MGIMEKFQRSWELFKSSLMVMQQNKKLLAFPILITVFTSCITLLFLVPVAFQPTGYSYTSSQHWSKVGASLYNVDSLENGSRSGQATSAEDAPIHRSRGDRARALKGVRPLAVGYFAVMYFVSMFCATFLNVAFYKQILKALNGEPVSIGDGIQFACTKWKIILMWTLFAGIVGFIIKSLEERFGLIGQWMMKLLGAVWSIACVFVIPVIVTEEETTNPVVVLKKSALTLTRTWGESLIGYAGVSFGGAIVMLASLVWLGAGIFISMSLHSYWLAGIVVLGWFIGICAFSYLMGVASQIFRCALFLYASQGTLPQPYTEEMVALAWKVKKR